LILISAAEKERCSHIGFLPRVLTLQTSHDYASYDETDSQKYDVHTFNRFFTFQVDRDVAMINEGVEMVIPVPSTPSAFKL
jgi:hypothetical protein